MKKNFLSFKSSKIAKTLFYCIGAFALSTVAVSCDNDDPDNGGGSVTNPVDLVVSPTTVSFSVGETKDCYINAGNGGYSTSITSKDVVSASIQGTTITLTALAEGTSIVIVKDAGDKSAAINVTVAKGVSGSNNINTSVKYNVVCNSGEKGAKGSDWTPALTLSAKNTSIITKRDFLKDENTTGWDKPTLQEYFANASSDDIFLCCGYLDPTNGTPDYGYTSPALLLTDIDDPTHTGCKKVTVIASNISAAMGWEGYTDNGGKAWYNPTDKSFTLEGVSGKLAWGWSFTYSRTYTPVE